MTVTRPQQAEPLIFKRSRPGRQAFSFQHPIEAADDARVNLPAAHLRGAIQGLPEVTESDVVRHFVRLSQWNYGVDTGFYPLGSCTMKYNPKVNEVTCRLPGLARVHPFQPEAWMQGALQVMWELGEFLKIITGMDAITLQPAAGAHGEYTGLKLIHRLLAERGDPRTTVLIPDTAHGTNPASCTLNGWKVVVLKSGRQGTLSPQEVADKMTADVAAVMITNPNTLGKFEGAIREVAEVVHARGGFVYADGANFNSFMGLADVKRLGVDVMHLNLHKTFSTPHGGGGPGAGPVVCTSQLAPFLPVPRVVKVGERFRLEHDAPLSVGKVHGFFGNFGVMVRAWTYIRELGPDGIRRAAELAVLNANYLQARLGDTFHNPYPGTCMHEFVVSDKLQSARGVHTINIAKRLIDKGFHPMTVYFPLIVEGAMMIEPTETESPETLDAFVQALLEVAREAAEDPETVIHAPHDAVRGLLDEVKAARTPVLRYKKDQSTP